MPQEISERQAYNLAARFHREYEHCARLSGYETRQESRVDWEDVPDINKQVMIRTMKLIFEQDENGDAVVLDQHDLHA